MQSHSAEDAVLVRLAAVTQRRPSAQTLEICETMPPIADV